MIETITTYSIVLIPLFVFFLTTGMKIYVGKDLHEISYAETFLQVPVDILFISVALTITYLTKSSEHTLPGVIILLAHLMISFFSVVVWRYSAKNLIKENLIYSGILGFLNYNLTIWPLIYVITLNLN